jgi:hypothetical protein|tara:strand:+ start:144 stop:413 length:270 start_codon:yes stop_codon:yes gene_type:complete
MMNEINLIDIVGVVRDIVIILSLILCLVLIFRTTKKINKTVDRINSSYDKVVSLADTLHLSKPKNMGLVYKAVKTILSIGRSKQEKQGK